MNWDIILGGVLPAIVSSGVFSWLLQKFIEHKYERRLEEMRNEHAKDLARLNSILQEGLDFKATRFRMVYERKIAALCEAFGRLAKMEKCLREYVTYFGDLRNPEREVARKEFAKALDDFETFFVPNRIFFPFDLAEQITGVKNDMNRMALKFMAAASEHTPPSRSGQAWDEANNYVDVELPKIRRAIETEIRAELGESLPSLEKRLK